MVMVSAPSPVCPTKVELATALALGYARHRGRPWAPQARSLLAGAATGPTRHRDPTTTKLARVGGSSPRRILCVDRESLVAATLVSALRRAGFNARRCDDGPAALVEVTNFRPHGCVFDLEAAGLGGCELAQWARSELGELVILIGMADQIVDELDQTATAAGFDFLLARPADVTLMMGLLAGPSAVTE
jgi:CheY-like chemotaxis protein